MSDLPWKEAIENVLDDAQEPMHYSDIAEAIAEKGLRTDLGATPANSVAATISWSIRNDGDDTPFVRVSRGYYTLKEADPASGEQIAAEHEKDVDEETGLINAFGMYWRRDLVVWTVVDPKLLGKQQPSSEPVDFCEQKGVYLLYDGSKIVYVGRTTDQILGQRLRQHTADRLNGRWDRFSWFGVFRVEEDGSLSSDKPEDFTLENLVTTMEAILIEGLEPPQNRKRGDEFRAVEFLQLEDPEIERSRNLELIDELKKMLQ